MAHVATLSKEAAAVLVAKLSRDLADLREKNAALRRCLAVALAC